MRIINLFLMADEVESPYLLDLLFKDPKAALTSPDAVNVLTTYGIDLVSAITVFVIGRWVAKFTTGLIVRAARRAQVDETLLGFLRNVVYLLLLVAVCIAALGCLGVDTTSLSAILAAAGFAVGMAMQGSLGNIASGVMLVVFKPFKVGDYIDLGTTSGTVVQIQMFSTILLTPDNVRVVVPNANITGGAISNYSAENKRRIDLSVSCGYSDDLKQVRSFLEELVESDSRVLTHPNPVVAVAELADSSVNFVVRPWVLSTDYWDVKFDLTERIKLGFDERRFTIPYPSRDVFMHPSDAA
ncbi:MAG: mechanosensitive ion channel [Fuerstiella sp.]|nr:mechanosensitive ion channel [Fuerstiella sp.]